MVHNLIITVLIDNKANEPFIDEWGLSILIEADSNRILLDTGASSIFAQNTQCLGINLSDVDIGVLSHAHYDHANGLDTFFTLNRDAEFVMLKGNCGNCFSRKNGTMEYIGIRDGILESYSNRIMYVDGLHQLFESIWLVPHRKISYDDIALRNELYTSDDGEFYPDDFSHEQSLVIETEKGLVIFNSCSHTGMTNILIDVKEALGKDNIYAYVGGLHLYKLTDDEIYGLCNEIRTNHVEHIFTGHCTGEHAYNILRDRLGNRVNLFYTGFRYEFL